MSRAQNVPIMPVSSSKNRVQKPAGLLLMPKEASAAMKEISAVRITMVTLMPSTPR